MAFRPTSPQSSFFEPAFMLPPKKMRILGKSWATPFRDVVLPLIDEELFRDAFAQRGRPNTSIRLLLGLHILKEINDLTDEQVIENLEFNLQWQHALGVATEADVCQKTLHNFRVRAMELGILDDMFAGLTAGLARSVKVQTVLQRLDSTHITSNFARLTRLGLLVETTTAFLRELRRALPALYENLDGGYRRRYVEREGYFSDARREQVPRRLASVAQDMYALAGRFIDDRTVRQLPSFGTLVEVFYQQCSVNEPAPTDGDDAPIEVALADPKTVSSNSIQTPHDTDATYGRKGKGYEVQVAETCDPDNAIQLITHVSVNGAHESDTHATMPVIEALDARGMKPEVLLADTAYSGGANLVAAAEKDVELVAPVQDSSAGPRRDPFGEGPIEPTLATTTDDEPKPAEPAVLTMADFAFDTTCHECLSCPAGHAPENSHMGRRLVAIFAALHCATCCLADACPTKPLRSGDRKLDVAPKSVATEIRQVEQRQAHFKERYKLRSGIESTNNELKHRHGLDNLRVRGRPRVELAVTLKAMALNAKRVVNHIANLARTSELTLEGAQ